MSNAIGSGNLPLVRRFFDVILCTSLVLLILITLSLHLTNDLIVSNFTSDAEIHQSTV